MLIATTYKYKFLTKNFKLINKEQVLQHLGSPPHSRLYISGPFPTAVFNELCCKLVCVVQDLFNGGICKSMKH